jgi:imidazolonepropionase-like amidohydrolase
VNPPMSQQILFRNFELLEPSFGELRGGYELLVEGDTVKQLSETPIKASEADVIDCGRRTLMPGLIDCHVHAIHSEVNVRFTIRQEVVSPIEIIRSATTIGAEVLRMPGKVGTLQTGAFSDAIVVDGNPLKDLALLGDQGKHLSVIMKAGILHKNRLN